ncbi:p-hydroxyphenylacetate 3-hydroxylase reductase component [Spongorhabdus nitratireducens]
MTQATEFDSTAFRRALGNFATGITVITATAPNGDKVGVTANSFNSVSLDPPLILWSIDKRSGSYPVFKEATHFAVNILAADQMHLSNHFARPSEDKFAGIDYETGFGKAPLLPDCSAVFQCENHEIIEGGDHWIMIGKVVAFEDVGRSPLLYHQGSYSVVMPFTQQSDQKADAAEPQERLDNNYYYLMTQAVRAYQKNYQPRQLATGLRTSEARILMVLGQDRALDNKALLKEVDMPQQEIESATEILLRKELIGLADGSYSITAKGVEKAAELWQIADQEQTSVFDQFSADDLATFKKVLKAIAN